MSSQSSAASPPLPAALSLAGLNLSLKMVKALMRLHDSGKGRIHLAAFKQLHHWLLNIGAGFQRFDHDHSGAGRMQAAAACSPPGACISGYSHISIGHNSTHVNPAASAGTPAAGTLSKEETYQALQYAGFQLAPAAFDALFHSFDPDE